jgi:hypothetical protein
VFAQLTAGMSRVVLIGTYWLCRAISREANCRGFLRWCVVRIEHNLALHRFEVRSNNNNSRCAIDTHDAIGSPCSAPPSGPHSWAVGACGRPNRQTRRLERGKPAQPSSNWSWT